MKKIIVTGGLGFIGSNLINILLKKENKVLNLDKISYSANFYNTKEFNKNKNYKFYKCDLNNKKKIEYFIYKFKPDVIFNLAAETHVDRSIDNPKLIIKNNLLSTLNLLEVFKKYILIKKSKLIHVSTDEVYGDILKGRANESYPFKPSSPYAASKAGADHLVYSYFKTYNLPVIVTNCSNNYGPRQHPEKLIPKLIYFLINYKDLPIYGEGKNSREWLHVDDHCEALIKIWKKGKIGNIYNIGSSENIRNIDIAKKLISICKSKINVNSKITFIKDRPGHDFRYALNSKKIMKELKWKPKIKFKVGINLTLDWYLNNSEYFNYLPKKDIISRLGNKND